MVLVRIYDWLRTIRAKRNVRKNATLIGAGHVIGPNSRVVLLRGATKEQVILESGVWLEGCIVVMCGGKVVMRENSRLGATSKILCVDSVEIGAYTEIAIGSTICDNNNHPISPELRKQIRVTPLGHDLRGWHHSTHAPIRIGENAWIGTSVRICKGVTLGKNSIAAACSVVTKNVPDNCIVAGNPAKIVKTDIDKLD